MSGQEHPPEVRAAVMAALLAGSGVTEVAHQYNLPSSTVSRWRANARQEAGLVDDIGTLLLSYLRENLQTLAAQAKFFRDPKWLQGQPAGELAILHGVCTDKAIRLLESLNGGPDV